MDPSVAAPSVVLRLLEAALEVEVRAPQPDFGVVCQVLRLLVRCCGEDRDKLGVFAQFKVRLEIRLIHTRPCAWEGGSRVPQQHGIGRSRGLLRMEGSRGAV